MKVKRIDAHDRLLLLNNQADYISQGCMDCIQNRPDEFTMPFYIFAHARTIESDEKIAIFNDDLYKSLVEPSYARRYSTIDQIPSARMIWAPRLTKPKAQENSMLFKAYPGSDNIKIIWLIPKKELWNQYNKGNMTESKEIFESIDAFKNNRAKLETKEDDDLTDEEVNKIYENIKRSKKKYKFEMI